MTDTPPPPLAPPDALVRVVDVDLPCPQCGYNLRTLRQDARCPECNADVARALRRGALVDADPRWLRRIARGARWLFFADVGLGLMTVSAVAVREPRVTLVVLVTVHLLGLWGAFALTAREPSASRAARAARHGWAVRIAAVVGWAFGTLPAVLYFVDLTPWVGDLVSYTPVAHVGGAIVLFSYLVRLAKRMPAGTLHQHAWVVVAGAGAILATWGVQKLIGLPDLDMPYACCAGCWVIIVYVWSCGALMGAWLAFASAARHATPWTDPAPLDTRPPHA